MWMTRATVTPTEKTNMEMMMIRKPSIESRILPLVRQHEKDFGFGALVPSKNLENPSQVVNHIKLEDCTITGKIIFL